MDVFVYIFIIAVLGFIKINNSPQETTSVEAVETIVEDGKVNEVDDSIPVASNLTLKKEDGAYTLILEELGLN